MKKLIKMVPAVILLNIVSVKGQVLTHVWTTDSLLERPESAVFCRKTRSIYVSNSNTGRLIKDGNGYISQISQDGKILNSYWVAGLNNPQGLAIYRRKLYVADIDEVVVIDIWQAKIIDRIKIDGSKFLNDLTVTTSGDIFITDTFAKKIFFIKNNKKGVYLDDSSFRAPNGILATQKGLYVLDFTDGIASFYNYQSKSLNKFSSGIPHADGMTSDEAGGYYVSSAWEGNIYHVDSKGEKKLLLSLTEQKAFAADIAYVPELNLLLIPTLNKALIAYKVFK